MVVHKPIDISISIDMRYIIPTIVYPKLNLKIDNSSLSNSQVRLDTLSDIIYGEEVSDRPEKTLIETSLEHNLNISRYVIISPNSEASEIHNILNNIYETSRIYREGIASEQIAPFFLSTIYTTFNLDVQKYDTYKYPLLPKLTKVNDIYNIPAAGFNYLAFQGLDNLLRKAYNEHKDKHKELFTEVVGSNIILEKRNDESYVLRIITLSNRKREIVGVGGKKKKDETDMEALQREFLEELEHRIDIKSYNEVGTMFYLPFSEINSNIENENDGALKISMNNIFVVRPYFIVVENSNKDNTVDAIKSFGARKNELIEVHQISVYNLPGKYDLFKKRNIVLDLILSFNKPFRFIKKSLSKVLYKSPIGSSLDLYNLENLPYTMVSPSTFLQLIGLYNFYSEKEERNNDKEENKYINQLGYLSVIPKSIMVEAGGKIYNENFI